MRELFTFLAISADGRHEGPQHDISWHRVDEEFNDFALEQLRGAHLLFGRRTYALMATHWPAASTKREDPHVARLMNEAPKSVVSRTLPHADWQGTTLLRGLAEVATLKRVRGPPIALLGSSRLGASLLREGLVDEVRLMLMPVLLGEGTAAYEGAAMRDGLALAQARTFRNGNVLLRYRTRG